MFQLHVPGLISFFIFYFLTYLLLNSSYDSSDESYSFCPCEAHDSSKGIILVPSQLDLLNGDCSVLFFFVCLLVCFFCLLHVGHQSSCFWP